MLCDTIVHMYITIATNVSFLKVYRMPARAVGLAYFDHCVLLTVVYLSSFYTYFCEIDIMPTPVKEKCTVPPLYF